MQVSQKVCQNRILCGARDQEVEFAVEQHHPFNVSKRGPLLRAREDVRQFAQVRVVRVLSRQASAGLAKDVAGQGAGS